MGPMSSPGRWKDGEGGEGGEGLNGMRLFNWSVQSSCPQNCCIDTRGTHLHFVQMFNQGESKGQVCRNYLRSSVEKGVAVLAVDGSCLGLPPLEQWVWRY